MIIGGFRPIGINCTELYNIQTGQSCKLASMPFDTIQHTGLYYSGYPIYCGGMANGTYDNKCYKYSQNSWQQASNKQIQSKNNLFRVFFKACYGDLQQNDYWLNKKARELIFKLHFIIIKLRFTLCRLVEMQFYPCRLLEWQLLQIGWSTHWSREKAVAFVYEYLEERQDE